MNLKKRILVAPLNWGLGHATRCIPIINALIAHGYHPIIASDGFALLLLQKEFPNLEAIQLPSYGITYPKKGSHLRLKFLQNSPIILKAIKAEHKLVQKLILNDQIDGIISDNRFGVYSNHVPSVYLTHQVQVLSGNTTWLSTKLHQKAMLKFDECWIPDHEGNANLSGRLGHFKNDLNSTKYIGPLSRFKKMNLPIKYDLFVLLSGPEPQRTLLESKLLSELKNYNGTILFVKGIIETEQKTSTQNNCTIYNFMTSTELEKAINESEIVLSRSGYTTIMDLHQLEKKAFFIPTPGQYEQLYLAEKFKEENVAPYCHQDDFSLEKLVETRNFKGFSNIENKTNYKELFSLFERE
jgi:uncharacterized protein (TIGR00661 family)